MIKCTQCSAELRDEESAVQFEDGWMHYYSCSDRKRGEGRFISRKVGTFVPRWLLEGRGRAR